MSQSTDITFEAGYRRLQDIAERLGSDEVPVHEMCDLFAEGKGLEQALGQYLSQQKERVDAIERGEGMRAFRVVPPGEARAEGRAAAATANGAAAGASGAVVGDRAAAGASGATAGASGAAVGASGAAAGASGAAAGASGAAAGDADAATSPPPPPQDEVLPF
jgi:exonuclease VII small subunit